MKLSLTRFFQRDLEQYPHKTRRYCYLTLTVVATIVLTYDVYVPSSVLPLVLHAFHLSLAGYNLYLIAYLCLSAFAALAASVADRVGRANLTVFGLLACSLIMLGIALSTTLAVFLALGVLLGCAEGIIFVATTALVRDFSPRLGRASAMSFWLIGATGGTLLATSLASLTLPYLGTWQSQYLLAGTIGLLAFLLCGLGLRELPASLRNQVITSVQERDLIEARAHRLQLELPKHGAWRQMLRPSIIVSSVGISLFVLMYTTVNFFFPLYLSTIGGFTLSQADGLVSVFVLVYMAMALVIGIVSDRPVVRKPYMLLGAVGAMIVTLFLIIGTLQSGPHLSLLFMTLLLILLGLSMGTTYICWMAGFTETLESINPALVATGLAIWSFILRCITIVAFLILPPIVGSQGQGWTTWWWMCLGGMLVFIPSIFLLIGYWNPVRARRETRAELRAEGLQV
jgi:MFS family permease